MMRTQSTRRTGRFTAGLASLAIAALTVLVPAQAASAASANDSITGVTIDEASVPGNFSSVTVRFTYAAPATATTGDTFTLTLPSELTPYTSGFDLTAPDGSVVATASVTGGVATFTYTDYVTTYQNVTGTGFFSALFTTTQSAGSDVTLNFATNRPTFTDIVTIIGLAPVDRTVAVKSGSWTRVSDQGVTQPGGAITWQATTPIGPSSTVTINDPITGAQTMDCISISIQSSTTIDPATGFLLDLTTVDPSRYTLDCTLAGFTIDFPEGTAEGEVILLGYTTTVLEATDLNYPNEISVTTDVRPFSASVTVSRFDAGGDGAGLGTLNITKALVGNNAAGQTGPFVIEVSCTLSGANITGFPKSFTFAGATTQSLAVPSGAVCTATEPTTGGATTSSVSAPVTITATPATLTVTNTFDPQLAKTGSDGASAVAAALMAFALLMVGASLLIRERRLSY